MSFRFSFPVECTYIVDFASVVGICLYLCNTAEAGEESLRIKVLNESGVVFSLILPLLAAVWKRRKSFTVCTPLIVIRFGTSGQLGSSNLLFGYGSGGAEEVAEEGEGG
jgi:hypothetical protein